MGLLFLSTLAYLPLIVAIFLNLIMPARRELAVDAGPAPLDAEISRRAQRQICLGVGLIVCLTIGQCTVLFYFLHGSI
ncbi:MAG TPA: hypothetical protein VFJ08_03390 [Salinisphaera sp.]|nr:hypothetical protein [Salinisphaera sp.]